MKPFFIFVTLQTCICDGSEQWKNIEAVSGTQTSGDSCESKKFLKIVVCNISKLSSDTHQRKLFVSKSLIFDVLIRGDYPHLERLLNSFGNG